MVSVCTGLLGEEGRVSTPVDTRLSALSIFENDLSQCLSTLTLDCLPTKLNRKMSHCFYRVHRSSVNSEVHVILILYLPLWFFEGVSHAAVAVIPASGITTEG